MENITMTDTTQMTRAGAPFSQVADRSFIVLARGESYTPTYRAMAVKDVAYFRTGRPPV